MTQLTPKDLPGYVRSVAGNYGLDPAAVLAMAQHEGISGNPGDNNSSFGPWQLHIGGALPSNIGQLGPASAQQWAWSTDGINYALGAMSKGGAKNTTGFSAVSAIAEWERSADIPGQAARAWASYGGWLSGIPIALNNFFTVITGGKQQKVGGDGTTEPTDGEGNRIVPVPATAGDTTQILSTPTGGTQDVRLGKVGPFDIGIPSGLVLGLMGMSLLLIGAILFVYGGMFRTNVGMVGASVRPAGMRPSSVMRRVTNP